MSLKRGVSLLNKELSKNELEFILERLVKNAAEASEEARNTEDEFKAGRALGCYEMLDIIVNELKAHSVNPADYGITIDPDRLL